MSVAGKEDDAGNMSDQGLTLDENARENVAGLTKDLNAGEGRNEEIGKMEERGKEKVGHEENAKEMDEGEDSSSEKGHLSDLKEHEKMALMDLRSMLEEAILMNKLFKKPSNDEPHLENNLIQGTDGSTKKVEEEKEKGNGNQENPNQQSDNEKETEKQENPNEKGGDIMDKGKAEVDEEDEKSQTKEVEEVVDKDIALWGVPLLPSKADPRTDVLLLKFLRARDHRSVEAFDMLRSTLQWRKENRIDSIMEEDFGDEFHSVGYMKGTDREGHPVCYNVYGFFADEEMCNKILKTESGRERFLRWRLQLLEKEIQRLDFSPGGISRLLQINDLKDTPGPSRKDVRLATRRSVAILLDNYPEFVAKNIFVNVPFWYYAFNAILSAFLPQRTKAKLVFSRPSRVGDTLVKYIAAEEIPVAYGGLRDEAYTEFSIQDAASELVLKAGTTETIEIHTPEVGSTLIWEVMITGWDVSYKEEYVPSDEASYTMIVKKERKISWEQHPIRNTFKNKEAGRLVITIENGIFRKKRILYRYKIKNEST